MFKPLMSTETAEKFFLNKAKDAIDTDFKATALETAAILDEFRRMARNEYNQSF